MGWEEIFSLKTCYYENNSVNDRQFAFILYFYGE